MNAIEKFWNENKIVERFANREPDDRLKTFLHRYKSPHLIRILDLGCAGGRNTEFLVRQAFDVWAVDFSLAMVEKTRERLFPLLGERVMSRVVQGNMDDFFWIPDDFYDLIVALGLYHNAQSESQLRAALKESSRILKVDGWLYTSSFMPGTVLNRQLLKPVPDHSFLYYGMHGDRACLLSADQWDVEMANVGMIKGAPHEIAKGASDKDERISLYSFYQKKRAQNKINNLGEHYEIKNR